MPSPPIAARSGTTGFPLAPLLALVSARDSRGVNRDTRVELTHRGYGGCLVPGDPARLGLE